jgi:transposase
MALVVWRTAAWKMEIVKRSHAAGFEVLPKRWIVERTFAWISRNPPLGARLRTLCHDRHCLHRLAMIRIMLRRLAANASS